MIDYISESVCDNNIWNLNCSVSLHVSGGTTVLCHAAMGTLIIDHLLVFPLLKLLDELGKWGQLSRVHQIELINEIYEVLEAGAQVGLRRQ